MEWREWWRVNAWLILRMSSRFCALSGTCIWVSVSQQHTQTQGGGGACTYLQLIVLCLLHWDHCPHLSWPHAPFPTTLHHPQSCLLDVHAWTGILPKYFLTLPSNILHLFPSFCSTINHTRPLQKRQNKRTEAYWQHWKLEARPTYEQCS